MSRKLDDEEVQRFERLALPMLPLLLRTAANMAHNEQDAGDLVQETLLKAIRSMAALRDEADIRSWLLTILRRTFIDGYRAGKRRMTLPLDEAAVDGTLVSGDANASMQDEAWSEPEALMERFEDGAVVEALRTLPSEIRWTLLLVDVEQLDQAEAAAILDVPIGTIKSRAHRGRQMLRDRLYSLAQSRGWLPATDEESKP